MSNEMLQQLATFVVHREMIRASKEAGEAPPWTNDEILQKYRFTCPRRMDDKVSRWLLDNWYEPNKNHPNILTATGIARFINKPEALSPVTNWVFGSNDNPPNWTVIRAKLKTLKSFGHTVFSAAYMVRCDVGVEKIDYVVECCRNLHPEMVHTDSMERTHAELSKVRGIGSFMAGQIVADLRWAMTGEWADKLTWAPVGPGSARGLARVQFPNDWKRNGRIYAQQPKAWLREFRELILADLPSFLPEELRGKLEAMDYQSCLCEWDKYERARNGEGRPKQLYRPA